MHSGAEAHIQRIEHFVQRQLDPQLLSAGSPIKSIRMQQQHGHSCSSNTHIFNAALFLTGERHSGEQGNCLECMGPNAVRKRPGSVHLTHAWAPLFVNVTPKRSALAATKLLGTIWCSMICKSSTCTTFCAFGSPLE